MTTERINRLQSLLNRIKHNAALPKQPLGQNLVLGGTFGSRSDVSTGPSVPVAQHAAAELKSDVAVQRQIPSTPFAAQHPAAEPSYSPVAVSAAPAPAGGAMVIGRVRPRVQTMIGVAPGAAAPPSAAPLPEAPPSVTQGSDELIEELDLDDAGVMENPSSAPPAATASLELIDDDLQDETPLQTSQVSRASDIDNLSWSEPPIEESIAPDSSRRARVASSMDEALVAAAAESDAQVPIKTPPPESGRQPFDGVYASVQGAAGQSVVPTPEQLGETLELEEPTAAEIELESVQSKASKPIDDLEVELPPRSSILEPPEASLPPDTDQDARHRAPEHSQVLATPDEEVDDIAAYDSRQHDNTLISDSSELQLQPDVTARTAIHRPIAVDVARTAQAFAPRSFLELLDASMQLSSK